MSFRFAIRSHDPRRGFGTARRPLGEQEQERDERDQERECLPHAGLAPIRVKRTMMRTQDTPGLRALRIQVGQAAGQPS